MNNDYESRLDFGGDILPALKCEFPASVGERIENEQRLPERIL